MSMPQLIRYDDPAAFLAVHGRWLRRREARNNFILGMAEANSAAVYFAGPGVAASLSRRGVSLAAGSEPKAIRALARELAGHDLRGTFGPLAETLVFVETWRRVARVQARRTRQAYGYRLARIKSIPEAEGIARLADDDDHPVLLEWLARFGDETGFGVSAADAPHLLRSPEWWIWENASEPAAMLRLARVSADSARVAYVYTPAQLRGRGYAGALTAYASALALARGDRALYLFTDAANDLANRLYRRIGYRKIGDFVQYAFSPR